MIRIGVLGGSFEPVHNGHLEMARQIKTAAGLDKIMFIPNNVNPGKAEIKHLSGSERMKLLELAVVDCNDFIVNDIEIKREGPSYTYDTLIQLKEEYPRDTEFSLILGSDSLKRLGRWKHIDELLKQFPVLIVNRAGEDNMELKALADEIVHNHGGSISVFDLDVPAVSSSQLRMDLWQGKKPCGLMPKACIDYIEAHDLFPLLIPRLKEYARASEKESRFRHTEGVVKAALFYAKRYGADEFRCEAAAWFHDTCKAAGNLEHGPAAAELIQKEFGVTDPAIVNAICYHTTARAHMCLEEIVVKMADLLEEGRTYPGVAELRARMTDDPYESMLILLKEERESLFRRGITDCPLTDQAIEWLEHIHERKHNG